MGITTARPYSCLLPAPSALPMLIAGIVAGVVGCASSTRPPTHTPTRAAPTTRVAGTITSAASGRPLGLAQAHAEAGGRTVATDLADDTGSYQLDLPGPGTYRIVFRSGARSLVFEGIVAHRGRTTPLDAQLDPRAEYRDPDSDESADQLGTIEGRILDGIRGETFPGAVVSLTAPSLPNAAMAMADEHGRFVFEGLQPDSYALSCYYHLIDKGNIEVRRSNIVVEPGRVTRVEVELDLKLR